MRLAVRRLFKTPFVTLIAVISLALGIGANTAIFSLIHQILLASLPVVHPERLANLAAPGPNAGSTSCDGEGDCNSIFSYPMFRDLQREQTSFTGIAAHRVVTANLAAHNHTISGSAMLVSGNYFPVLGVRPLLGRLIGPNDDASVGMSPVAVLSYRYWQDAFGSDSSVLNQTLVVNGKPLTIIGVAPRGFMGTSRGVSVDAFVPITLQGAINPFSNRFERRDAYWVYAFGRLKPGMTLERASTAINVPYHAVVNTVEAPLQKGMSDATMARFRDRKLILTPGYRGQSEMLKFVRTPLALLMSVTVLVLLIACVNIANLLLARGASRASEMSVRLAIGGSRGQLVLQLLGESCLLGLIGGAFGLLVARATLGGIAAMIPNNPAAVFSVHLDWTMVWFTAAVSVLTSVAFGLFPALYATRLDLITVLRGQGGQPSGGRAAGRWRTGLATAQIALSMALLASAGLFVRSLINVSRVNLGIKIEHLATFGISPELNGYAPQRSEEFMLRLEDGLRALPGVTGVTMTTVPIVSNSNWSNDVDVDGMPTGPGNNYNANFSEIGAGYFATLGEPVLSGREFTRADAIGTPKVAIVNQAFARKFNLGANPVGRRMDTGDRKFDIEIVGLVRDAKYSSVKDSTPAVFFTPTLQDSTLGSVQFYVRTPGDPGVLLKAVPAVVAKLDPNLPVESARTMPDQVRENVFLDRFVSQFAAIFAALATVLAAIGLYGVLAYTVSQRTREFGVRMALGANPLQVLLLVLRQVGVMLLIGGVLGLAVAVAVGRVAQSLLYRMEGAEPLVLGVAAVILGAVALAAGAIPAWRASRVEPTQALRYE